MRGEDTAKLKTAQLFLYVRHADVLDRIFPALVLMVLDAVEHKTAGGHAERDAEAGHVFAVGNGFVEVLAVDDIQQSIAEAADHKDSPVGNIAETAAFFVKGYFFYFLVVDAHD